MKPTHKMISQMIQHQGLDYTFVHGKKHHKWKIRLPNSEVIFTGPGTPSCPRSHANTYSTLRRVLRNKGHQWVECKDLIR